MSELCNGGRKFFTSLSHQAEGPSPLPDDELHKSLDCREGVFYQMILSDILILIAFVMALYNFRWGNPEYLSALVQKVSAFVYTV